MKSKVKKIAGLLLAAVMVFAMTACGNDGDNTYLAVTEPTFPPFDTTDEEGNIIGFDMDLMNAIAEDQGFHVDYMSLGFDALIPALEADEADIITAGMNAEDPERQAKVDFSDTYFDSELVVLVAEENDTIKGFDSLTSDMKVTCQIGTTGEDKANELAKDGKIAKAVVLDQFTTCVQQVINGDAQACIIDKPVAEAYMAKQSGKVKIVGEPEGAESYGFAVQKGNQELLDKINAGLKNVKENGTYDELVMKWFK